MPQDPAAALSALLRQSSIEDHDEALKIANAALKANKNDVDSQHTRIIALLKLDRFDDALRAIADGSPALHARIALEHAYALYKTGNLDEATSVLQAFGLEKKRSLQHVAAQVAYRAERFDEACNIYSRLLDTDPADEENDISINLRAAFAQSSWLGYSVTDKISVQDSDGFELCYNAACAYIANGSLETAADLLQRASRLCDASDDLTDEDKQAEMRPILAQQAYVFAKLGKLKEALDLYNSLSSTKEEDPDLALIIGNNLVTLEPKVENPYLLERRFSTLTAKARNAKLFQHQSYILRRNRLTVDLQILKGTGVKRRTDALLAEATHPSTAAETSILSVLNAAASAQGTSGKQLLKNLQGLAQKRPHDVGLVLTIVQIQLNEGKVGSAMSILESFLQRLEKNETDDSQNARFSPGLVALTVTLLRTQGRESSAKAELVKAATYWQSRPANSAISLLEEAGIELMKSSNAQDLQLAGTSFQKLIDERKGSDIAAAGLVASFAPSDPSRVEKHLQNLPPVDSLIEGIDVTALLSAGVATTASKAGSSALKRSAPSGPTEKTRKRRRKIRLPKNYVEGTKPDPERWLPLRDRSSYRPKGKKGKKKAVDSTQGGIVKEEETLELVGGGGVKVEKAPPPSKKKKKGKK
ncbi:signal recognition particle subunit SRP72 [Fusarium oxysporum f. sp. lycopersici 4287]|uniref:Signal recognition particle subunit SRP72 n=3 Tax=Fusarium oxysporum TaxID=5507 RepID=A0A0J9URH6_FUSO4|nr:signal recognition particle subunit SRP72 [Fusarium oxysporum f. sp. lycopersici 4287]EXK44125.1 signal recognition particle subunit SRP72 [Fusarium oxysporum f. sp. melonis 26406]KAJ9427389.1 signal recognition particle subunit SRP72 [Fusarium oxysporum]KNB00806.1 signal recognition particle subunit SRP72 [Fusarium oxysporum f. sp. lycopersici 4287]